MAVFGQEIAARRIAIEQQAVLQRRDDVRENSSREARNSFTFTTDGSGYIVPRQPITFDCLFLQEPHFTSGVALVRSPDLNLWHYPIVTAGVYRWIKQPQRPAVPGSKLNAVESSGAGTYRPRIINSPDDTEDMYYTGAFMYYAVICEPDLFTTTPDADILRLTHPPSTKLHHHLTFTGTAQKKLPTPVTDISFDREIVAATTPLGTGA